MARITDDELVRRFQSGSDREQVFEQLLDRYVHATAAFFRRRVGDEALAADMNQELYLSLYRSLDRFRLESSFKTWLFRLARHQISHLRRRWRVHLDERPVELEPAIWEQLAVSGRTPLEEVESRWVATVLRRCLATLQEVERFVVIGQYYRGETLEELGEELGLTNRSGARAPLISAQRKLRKCLRRAGVKGASPLEEVP